MEQPPGFVAQGEFSGLVCRLRKSLYGLKQSPRAWFVYVDDIVLTGSDHHGISQIKHLCHHFQTKDLGKLRYFLGIEVAQSTNGIVIS
uniref:Retrovirus-related Pol polyprotein from transposon TNT 1-94 n=1 Tax=Cajanus cajan TaxID=3821 RepID=A0A151RQY3_CAJCA|nr:Retrovirus-related Pol polyprotein from transposon TNT 1-94 [Cajanus cajan]